MYISCANDRGKKWREIEKWKTLEKTKFLIEEKSGSSAEAVEPKDRKQKALSMAMLQSNLGGSSVFKIFIEKF